MLLTLFGGSVILWGIQVNLMAQANWSVTANAFKSMKEAGMEVSDGAMKFAETWGGEPSLLNQPVAIVFFLTAFLIILFPIWFKK